MRIRVASLHLYPVKATGGVSVDVSDVELSGLRHDRRWAVIDPEGVRLNASTHDRLLSVTTAPHDDDGAITVSTSGMPDLLVPVPTGGEQVAVDVSRFSTMTYAGDAAAQWFSEVLGTPVRLAWQDDPARRTIATSHGGRGGEALSLADTAPLLLTSTASLARLNTWVGDDHGGAPLEMARFRPNVVVEGELDAFAEDHWRDVEVGDVRFRFAEHCDRCVVTTIDPATLEHGKEPIRTLARYRRWDGKTWFGVRLVPLAPGRVAVGDPVTPV